MIRDLSRWPDELVPAWVRQARERGRHQRTLLCSCNLHFGVRGELLSHCDKTGHKPLVVLTDDPYLKRL